MRSHARHLDLLRSARKCRQRRHPGLAQPLDLVAAHARHEYEMIVGDPARLAYAGEVAQSAMLDGPGLGRSGRRDCVLEPASHATVVGREVVVAQPTRCARAQMHMHVLGTHSLNGGNTIAVEAELKDVGGFLRARELRVERLVAPWPEVCVDLGAE